MLAFILSLLILFVALYGYFLIIRKSKLEKELRQNNLDYECYKCKEKLPINTLKCPKCSLVTIYGSRRKNFWLIIPIIITWLFMLSKFGRGGMF